MKTILIGALVIGALIAAVTHPWPGWLLLGGFIAMEGYFGVREGRQGRQVKAKRELARLEAEAGVPLVEGLEDCAECGKPLVAGARFCTYCRTPTARALRGVCSACGTRNQPDAAWCSQCGARVDGVLPKGLLSLEPPFQTSRVPSTRPKRL